MNEIKLQLKAKYFRYADFTSNDDCPVARAIKDQLKAKTVDVTPMAAVIDGEYFSLEYYSDQFHIDELVAKDGCYSDLVINELTLTK